MDGNTKGRSRNNTIEDFRWQRTLKRRFSLINFLLWCLELALGYSSCIFTAFGERMLLGKRCSKFIWLIWIILTAHVLASHACWYLVTFVKSLFCFLSGWVLGSWEKNLSWREKLLSNKNYEVLGQRELQALSVTILRRLWPLLLHLYLLSVLLV